MSEHMVECSLKPVVVQAAQSEWQVLSRRKLHCLYGRVRTQYLLAVWTTDKLVHVPILNEREEHFDWGHFILVWTKVKQWQIQ